LKAKKQKKQAKHSETPEMIELRKCTGVAYHNRMRGFLYFVNKFVWIEDRKSKRAIPFKLWPGQIEAVPRFFKSKFLIILKARQLGLTWLVAAYVLWCAIFNYHEFIVVISAKEDLSIEFLDRVKFIFDRLPGWMKPVVFKRSTIELSFGVETKDEKGNIVLEGLNSVIKSIPSTPDAGQSKTITRLILDESALNRYCKEIWGAANPTLEHAGGQAIIISNPSKNRPGWSWTRDLYTNAMKGLNRFSRIFLDWRCVPGRGVDFLEKKAKEENLDEEDISMQYPSDEAEAVSTLGGSYFGRSLGGFSGEKGENGYFKEYNGEIQFVKDDSGIVEIWNHPDNSMLNRYAVGSDVSEGIGETYSVGYVYDRFENVLVARIRSNKIDADVWADKLIELARYYGDAMIGVERNGAGITTVMHLAEKYDNLFYRRRPGKMKGAYVFEYGWLETRENKQILADELRRHYRLVFTKVPCQILIDECSTFIRHDSGKLEHEDGKMDDCVIAAGVTLQVSIMMNTVVEKEMKPAKSMTEKRIEALEATSEDDYERFISTEYARVIQDL